MKNAENHFLLLKKLKNASSAQLCVATKSRKFFARGLAFNGSYNKKCNFWNILSSEFYPPCSEIRSRLYLSELWALGIFFEIESTQFFEIDGIFFEIESTQFFEIESTQYLSRCSCNLCMRQS